MQTTSARSAGRQSRGRTGYRRWWGILAVIVVLAGLAGFAAAKLIPPGPAASVPVVVMPGAGTGAPLRERLAAVPWPAAGVSAADVSGVGVVAGPGATRPVPIASVAKVMTAYLTLQQFPLAPGAEGFAAVGGRFAGLDASRWPCTHSPSAVLLRLAASRTPIVDGAAGPVETSFVVNVEG